MQPMMLLAFLPSLSAVIAQHLVLCLFMLVGWMLCKWSRGSPRRELGRITVTQVGGHARDSGDAIPEITDAVPRQRVYCIVHRKSR